MVNSVLKFMPLLINSIGGNMFILAQSMMLQVCTKLLKTSNQRKTKLIFPIKLVNIIVKKICGGNEEEWVKLLLRILIDFKLSFRTIDEYIKILRLSIGTSLIVSYLGKYQYLIFIYPKIYNLEQRSYEITPGTGRDAMLVASKSHSRSSFLRASAAWVFRYAEILHPSLVQPFSPSGSDRKSSHTIGLTILLIPSYSSRVISS